MTTYKHIKKFIGNDDNKALKLISEYVNSFNADLGNIQKKIADKELDSLCCQLACKIHKNSEMTSTKQNVNIIIVSKLHNRGGHTRQVLEFCKYSKDKVYIISTECNGRSKLEYVNKNKAEFVKIILLNSSQSFIQKCLELRKIVSNLNPSKIFLFNDMADSSAVCSLADNNNYNIYYYHHANLYLSLGLSIPGFKVINFSPISYLNFKNNINNKNIYIPLSYSKRNQFVNDKRNIEDNLNVCMIGSYNKVNIPYDIDYESTVYSLISSVNLTFFHIGKLSPIVVIKLRIKLFFNGISQNRFRYLKNVYDIPLELHRNMIHLVLSSFPIGGALTLIECMSAGVPVAIHDNVYLNQASCKDTVYSKAFVWKDSTELINVCHSLDNQKYNLHSEESYKYYLSMHTGKHLEDFFVHTDEYNLIPEIKKDYEASKENTKKWEKLHDNIVSKLYKYLFYLKNFLRRYF